MQLRYSLYLTPTLSDTDTSIGTTDRYRIQPIRNSPLAADVKYRYRIP